MKIYTIIAGVNGAGKSSLAGALRVERSDLGLIIDPDKLTALYNDPLKGGKEAIARIDNCLLRGVSFTQETTLSGVRTENTIKRAKEAGYYIRLYYIGLNSADESITRIKNRVAKGGHNIPESDVIRRFSSRFADLIKILPYCDEAVLFDNENGFLEIAEYKNGELIPKGEYRPAWYKELSTLLP